MSAVGARLSLAIRPLRLALSGSITTAHGQALAHRGALVRASAGGLSGWGEAVPLPGFGTEELAAAEGALERARLALTSAAVPLDAAGLEALLDETVPAGCRAARAALECALLDLRARLEGRPLRALLARERAVLEGVAPSLPLDRLSPSALLSDEGPAQAAARAAAEGFAAVKLKVAARPLIEDLARVRQVRAAAAGLALRLDANGGWSRGSAAAALEALAEVRPELCEQPLPPGDPGAWPALARVCPLAADESCADPAEIAALLDAGCLRAVVLKPPALGGLLPSLRFAARARARGVLPLVTSSLDSAVGRAAAAHLAAALRVELAPGVATGRLLAEDVCADPLEPRAGRIQFGQSSGLGLEVDAGIWAALGGPG